MRSVIFFSVLLISTFCSAQCFSDRISMNGQYMLYIDTSYDGSTIYKQNLYTQRKTKVLYARYKIKHFFWGWDDNTIVYCGNKGKNFDSSFNNLYTYNVITKKKKKLNHTLYENVNFSGSLGGHYSHTTYKLLKNRKVLQTVYSGSPYCDFFNLQTGKKYRNYYINNPKLLSSISYFNRDFSSFLELYSGGDSQKNNLYIRKRNSSNFNIEKEYQINYSSDDFVDNIFFFSKNDRYIHCILKKKILNDNTSNSNFFKEVEKSEKKGNKFYFFLTFDANSSNLLFVDSLSQNLDFDLSSCDIALSNHSQNIIKSTVNADSLIIMNLFTGNIVKSIKNRHVIFYSNNGKLIYLLNVSDGKLWNIEIVNANALNVIKTIHGISLELIDNIDSDIDCLNGFTTYANNFLLKLNEKRYEIYNTETGSLKKKIIYDGNCSLFSYGKLLFCYKKNDDKLLSQNISHRIPENILDINQGKIIWTKPKFIK